MAGAAQAELARGVVAVAICGSVAEEAVVCGAEGVTERQAAGGQGGVRERRPRVAVRQFIDTGREEVGRQMTQKEWQR